MYSQKNQCNTKILSKYLWLLCKYHKSERFWKYINMWYFVNMLSNITFQLRIGSNAEVMNDSHAHKHIPHISPWRCDSSTDETLCMQHWQRLELPLYRSLTPSRSLLPWLDRTRGTWMQRRPSALLWRLESAAAALTHRGCTAAVACWVGQRTPAGEYTDLLRDINCPW